MKKILILLTILLLAISCSNGSTNPGGNAGNSADTGTGKPEVEIDPNKANIKVTTYVKDYLPIKIIIVGSDGKEIPIGQLTLSDAENPDNIGFYGTYSKVFTFTPGTYTLILRPNSTSYSEEKYENLSFSAGTLEEYTFK